MTQIYRRLMAPLLTVALVLGLTASVAAQTTVASTTLSSAVTATGNSVILASGTGVAVGTLLYVDGELMRATSITGSFSTTNPSVRRGVADGRTVAVAHLSGEEVWVIPNAANQVASAFFVNFPATGPSGSCTASLLPYLPIINTKTGEIWDCAQNASSATNGISTAQWTAWASGYPVSHVVPRAVVAGVAYTIKISDYIVALSTTGTGTGGVSVAVQTWTLPSHVGHPGKVLVLKDESGGITATTYVSIAGTVDGVSNAAAAKIGTAYGGVTLYAGSGGWFTVGCKISALVNCQ